MKLRVIHETVYQYTPAVQNAQHMAHLRPRTGPVQRVLTHALQIDPAPAQCEAMQDVFGNTRAFFSLPFTHEQLRVRAESLLETSPPPPAPLASPGRRCASAWPTGAASPTTRPPSSVLPRPTSPGTRTLWPMPPRALCQGAR